MSLSIFNHRFLLDENVRIELADFFKARQINFKKLPKSSPDRLIRSVSLKEKRIVVTNDQDFSFIPQGKIFGVIWLQIPQREAQTLLHCFQKLLLECHAYEDHLIVLDKNTWKSFPLKKRLNF